MITVEKREYDDAQEDHTGSPVSLKVKGSLFEKPQASLDVKGGHETWARGRGSGLAQAEEDPCAKAVGRKCVWAWKPVANVARAW